MGLECDALDAWNRNRPAPALYYIVLHATVAVLLPLAFLWAFRRDPWKILLSFLTVIVLCINELVPIPCPIWVLLFGLTIQGWLLHLYASFLRECIGVYFSKYVAPLHRVELKILPLELNGEGSGNGSDTRSGARTIAYILGYTMGFVSLSDIPYGTLRAFRRRNHVEALLGIVWGMGSWSILAVSPIYRTFQCVECSPLLFEVRILFTVSLGLVSLLILRLLLWVKRRGLEYDPRYRNAFVRMMPLFLFALVFVWTDPGMATYDRVIPYFNWFWILAVGPILIREFREFREAPRRTPKKTWSRLSSASGMDDVTDFPSYIGDIVRDVEVMDAFEIYLQDAQVVDSWYFILDTVMVRMRSERYDTTWTMCMIHGLVGLYLWEDSPMQVSISAEDRSRLMTFLVVYQNHPSDSVCERALLTLIQIANTLCHDVIRDHWVRFRTTVG